MPAAQRQTEHASRQSKLRAQGSEDYRLPETVRHPQPHYREVKKRYLWRSVNDSVYPETGIRCPGYPESHHQDKGHDVTRIAQVFRKRGRVLLVVYQYAGS